MDPQGNLTVVGSCWKSLEIVGYRWKSLEVVRRCWTTISNVELPTISNAQPPTRASNNLFVYLSEFYHYGEIVDGVACGYYWIICQLTCHEITFPIVPYQFAVAACAATMSAGTGVCTIAGASSILSVPQRLYLKGQRDGGPSLQYRQQASWRLFHRIGNRGQRRECANEARL